MGDLLGSLIRGVKSRQYYVVRVGLYAAGVSDSVKDMVKFSSLVRAFLQRFLNPSPVV